MVRRLIVVMMLSIVPRLALADSASGVDWNRRVVVGHGQGAPDLNAPSIAVARLGAERAAKLDAARNVIEQLKGMELTAGGNVGKLLQDNGGIGSALDSKIKGLKAIKYHYFSDGGVSLDVELPLDELPPELASQIKVPAGQKALASAGGPTATSPGADKLPDGAIAQVAQGQAAVLNGDKPAAREKAIEDALRHAVEMAVGTRVKSTTEVQDFQSKMDQVLTHSQGFVKRYELVNEGMDGDVVQVTVRAIIATADLDKDLEAMGLLNALKHYPRTMVLVAEQNIGMVAPAAVWMKGGEHALVSADLRVAETALLDTLRTSGFGQLIDPDVAGEKAAQVGGMTTEINAAQARRLKSLTGAEVIVIGQVIAQSRGENEALGAGWRSCSATITGRAVNTDNGDILATSDNTQNAAQLDDLTCGKEAIKRASKAFGQEMVKKIGERWTKDVSGGNEVHVTVRKVDSLRKARAFSSALGQSIRGVKKVAQRSYGGGVQELDVTLVGATDRFAEELETKKLGKFAVHVTGVTANTVEVELAAQ